MSRVGGGAGDLPFDRILPPMEVCVDSARVNTGAYTDVQRHASVEEAQHNL